MIVGSLPIDANARMRARGLRPDLRADALAADQHAAAPSTMPLELPAVCTWLIDSTCGYFMMATASKPASSPICVKAGFSFARSAIVVPGRRYSSRSPAPPRRSRP